MTSLPVIHRVACTRALAAALSLVSAVLFAQVNIPTRPAAPVFQSQQGRQRATDITFDPQTRSVTIRLSVEDPNGYFIPNLRPENFAVYEDGHRQSDVTAEVEHAPVTLAVLLEGGGRYQQLNKTLSHDVAFVAHPLVEALKADDTVAVFSYTDSVRALLDFSHPNDRLSTLFDSLPAPVLSEANLYDALSEVLNRLPSTPGRKAVLLISTGLDTFSHATFDDVRAQAQRSEAPVYIMGLSERVMPVVDSESPLAKIDWRRVKEQLRTLATVSGGRTYLHDTALDVFGPYDDMMEHLRVRYVLRYVSSNPGNANSRGSTRTVRVALVNPRGGAPLRITDAAGKTIAATVNVQASYTP